MYFFTFQQKSQIYQRSLHTDQGSILGTITYQSEFNLYRYENSIVMQQPSTTHLINFRILAA